MNNFSKKDFNKSIAAIILIVSLTVIVTETWYVFFIQTQIMMLVYLLSIFLIAALTDGYIYGISSAILISIIYDYLVTYPVRGFSFYYIFPITLVMMLLISITISIITTYFKKRGQMYREKEERSHILYNLNNELQATNITSIDSITDMALRYINQKLDYPTVFYVDDPLKTDSARFTKANSILLSDDERIHAHNLYYNDMGDYITDDNDSETYYHLLASNETTLGLIGIYKGLNRLSEEDISFLTDISMHLVMAIELQKISESKRKTEIEAETERVRSRLLRAVSHDLRTPLTSITGESTLIYDNVTEMDDEEIKKYAYSIRENSQWLIGMVENLLMVTRITDNTIEVKKEKEVVEEILAHGTHIVRKRFPNSKIDIVAPEEPVLATMDAILLTQVIINLLENALKYSEEGTPVLLKLDEEEDKVIISVFDRGPGIDESLHDDVFNGNIRKRIIDSGKGLGLGLMLCKTIIDAHNGEITYKNREDGGTVFIVSLPK